MTGAASLLVLAVVAVAVGLVAAIGHSTPVLVDQARADAVADLAALAGVGGGDAAARTVAERSGATAVRVDGSPPGAAPDAVVVSVVVGGRSAVATAAPSGSDPFDEPVGGP